MEGNNERIIELKVKIEHGLKEFNEAAKEIASLGFHTHLNKFDGTAYIFKDTTTREHYGHIEEEPKDAANCERQEDTKANE